MYNIVSYNYFVVRPIDSLKLSFSFVRQLFYFLPTECRSPRNIQLQEKKTAIAPRTAKKFPLVFS